MSNYYSINPRFYISVDCIIFGFNEGELNLLLLKRNFQPAMGEWSLMGGFVQQGESGTMRPSVYWQNSLVWKMYIWSK